MRIVRPAPPQMLVGVRAVAGIVDSRHRAQVASLPLHLYRTVCRGRFAQASSGGIALKGCSAASLTPAEQPHRRALVRGQRVDLGAGRRTRSSSRPARAGTPAAVPRRVALHRAFGGGAFDQRREIGRWRRQAAASSAPSVAATARPPIPAGRAKRPVSSHASTTISNGAPPRCRTSSSRQRAPADRPRPAAASTAPTRRASGSSPPRGLPSGSSPSRRVPPQQQRDRPPALRRQLQPPRRRHARASSPRRSPRPGRGGAAPPPSAPAIRRRRAPRHRAGVRGQARPATGPARTGRGGAPPTAPAPRCARRCRP